MTSTKLAVSCAAFGLWSLSAGAATLSPEDAAGHVGETATVCGVVASAKFATSSRAQPTFLGHGEAVSKLGLYSRDLWGRSAEVQDPRNVAPRKAHLRDRADPRVSREAGDHPQ
jgi:hypothetical protein